MAPCFLLFVLLSSFHPTFFLASTPLLSFFHFTWSTFLPAFPFTLSLFPSFHPFTHPSKRFEFFLRLIPKKKAPSHIWPIVYVSVVEVGACGRRGRWLRFIRHQPGHLSAVGRSPPRMDASGPSRAAGDIFG